MKRFFYYLLLIPLMNLLVSCETTDADFTDSSYYLLNTSFIYPVDAGNNYVLRFNGDTLGFHQYFPTNESGTLEVLEKGQTEAEYSQELTMSGHTTLQFIKLAGEPVALYVADQYTTFSVNLNYADGEDPAAYQILFNGRELANGVATYIRIDQLTGTLEIRKEGTSVYYAEVTVTPDNALSYLQLTETDYLRFEVDTEPLPEGNQTKARFFYLGKDIPDVEEVELTLYVADRSFRVYDELTTINIKADEISDYLLVDWDALLSNGAAIRRVSYDLKNKATGELLVDHTIQGRYLYTTLTNSYKKLTIQLSNNGADTKAVISEM